MASKDTEEALAAIREAQRLIDAEASNPTVRFSAEAKAALSNPRFRLAEVSRTSLQELTASGHLIRVSSPEPDVIIRQISSPKSEVATLAGIFLPQSGSRDLGEQMRLLNDFDRKLREEIPDVKAVMGNVAFYADLICNQGVTFTDVPRSGGIRTSSPFGGGLAVIDSSSTEYGLFISKKEPTDRYMYLQLAPLIVPADLRLD